MVNWLIARQGERGETDAQFARFLAVSRPTWILVKGGSRRPSDWFRLRVLRAYPDRCQELLALEEVA